MDAIQLDIFAALEKASDTRPQNLCKTWENAVLNDCGVFVEGMRTFEAKQPNGIRCVQIHCALDYPKVYYTFGAMDGTSGFAAYPGRNDSNFDVHEHPANVMLMVEHAIMPKFEDGTIMQKLARQALEMMAEAINEGSENSGSNFPICKTCGDEFMNLCSDGNCVECEYKRKHPDAQKKFCKDCIHFRYHNLYDENDKTECCCKLHLEGKHRHEWSYLCKDFVKIESAKDIQVKYDGLVTYASYKKQEKCPDCKKNFRFLYKGLCLPCYEKKRKKAEEIARSFCAEGWKEVPEKEKENAIYEINGWIDERNMDAMEPRKGTRFFMIDIKSLTWKFFFKKDSA